jgi:Carboxypeptidase regulatory-like domain
MSRLHVMLLAVALSTLMLTVSVPAISPSPAPSIELTGTVKGADGKAMEGVAVSARAEGTTITTSVWTNENGAYAFPALDAGRYRVWAQAVGFDRPVAEAAIAPGKGVQQDFTLKPLPNIIPRQLSTAEWLARLPDDTAFDRRMKMVVLNNCSNCHLPANWLEKRFDRDSWETVLDYMEKIAPDGDVPEDGAGDPKGRRAGGAPFPEGELDANGDPIGIHTKLIRFYRKDLVEYLTKVAGPNPVPLKPTPFPRPTGVETQLVVTEYDLPWDRPGGIGKLDPRSGRVSFLTQRDGRTVAQDAPVVGRNEYKSGSDWSWGTRENQHGTHDMALGNDGNVYFAGGSMSMDITRDTIWIGGRTFTSFDVKTQTLKTHSRVPTVMSHGVDVDTKGNVWGSTGLGAVRMNIETGEITEFKTLTPDSRPYDIGIDRLDNVWLSQIAIDKMAVIDSRTGDVTEVAIPSLKSPDIRPEDVEIFNTVGSWDHNSALGQQGPRRMVADRRGDFVYSGLYWAGGIAQFDVRTKTLVKVHQVPNGRWSQPYKPFPDKNHIVWFGNSADDRLGRLNPTTGAFTMYPLPTRGTNSRHLAVDDSTDPPTVWVPYTGAGKIARVQFRTDTAKD